MVGPRTVDFGKVSMGSTNTRHLVVHNTLEHYINVVLDIKHLDMLRDSPATSQVIPPGARAAFPLVLQVRCASTAACRLPSKPATSLMHPKQHHGQKELHPDD